MHSSLLWTTLDCGCGLVHTVPFQAQIQEGSALTSSVSFGKLVHDSCTSRPRNDNGSLLFNTTSAVSPQSWPSHYGLFGKPSPPKFPKETFVSCWDLSSIVILMGLYIVISFNIWSGWRNAVYKYIMDTLLFDYIHSTKTLLSFSLYFPLL